MKSQQSNYDLALLREASSPKSLIPRPNNNQAASSDALLHGSTSARTYKPSSNNYQVYNQDASNSKLNMSKLKASFLQYNSNITVKQMVTAGLSSDIKVNGASNLNSNLSQAKRTEASSSASRINYNIDRKQKPVVKSYISLTKDFNNSNSNSNSNLPRGSLASQSQSRRDNKNSALQETNSNPPSTSSLPKNRSHITSETPTNMNDSSPGTKLTNVNPAAYRPQIYKSPEKAEDSSQQKKLDFDNFASNSRNINDGSARKRNSTAIIKNSNKVLGIGQLEDAYGNRNDMFYSPAMSPTNANSSAKDFNQKFEQILTKPSSQKSSFIMSNNNSSLIAHAANHHHMPREATDNGHYELFQDEIITPGVESNTLRAYKIERPPLEKSTSLNYRLSHSPAQKLIINPSHSEYLNNQSNKTRALTREFSVPDEHKPLTRQDLERDKFNNSAEGRSHLHYPDGHQKVLFDDRHKKILSESPVKRGVYKLSLPVNATDEALNTSNARTQKKLKAYMVYDQNPHTTLAEAISYKQIRLSKVDHKKYPATTKNANSNAKKFEFGKGSSGGSISSNPVVAYPKSREKIRLTSPNVSGLSVMHSKDFARDNQNVYGGNSMVEQDRVMAGNSDSARMGIMQEVQSVSSMLDMNQQQSKASSETKALKGLDAIVEKTRTMLFEQKKKEYEWSKEKQRMLERISLLEGKLRDHEEVDTFQL